MNTANCDRYCIMKFEGNFLSIKKKSNEITVSIDYYVDGTRTQKEVMKKLNFILCNDEIITGSQLASRLFGVIVEEMKSSGYEIVEDSII